MRRKTERIFSTTLSWSKSHLSFSFSLDFLSVFISINL